MLRKKIKGSSFVQLSTVSLKSEGRRIPFSLLARKEKTTMDLLTDEKASKADRRKSLPAHILGYKDIFGANNASEATKLASERGDSGSRIQRSSVKSGVNSESEIIVAKNFDELPKDVQRKILTSKLSKNLFDSEENWKILCNIMHFRLKKRVVASEQDRDKPVKKLKDNFRKLDISISEAEGFYYYYHHHHHDNYSVDNFLTIFLFDFILFFKFSTK
jgi:hypothetical protein